MGTEIERKFLLTGDGWRDMAVGIEYRQGYLGLDKERTVRVRIAGDQAFLTIKGKTNGISRMEYEYPIPVEDASILLAELCEQPIIEKKRYKISYQGFVWEVDEFFGKNEGLLVAEIELEEEGQEFEKPPWVGMEVSSDRRYCNASLVKNPFSGWEH
ncbi:MAG: CYTH domain-containing protein [Proteobacteria bacterium]|jgi:adenylate cyclase|nr:CYTH domain-containing protein [Desulfocapsa sp.]MBU3944808.1 CYTH domain-containing protein [Pseudomonadota bacterium]MCG2745657.1 CYTH domain-containing protein [Desulfobacteraceae bacterium]MDO8945782.1 CYTH domain-containing protein [Desulfocapsaceae bacterium]MBU4029407.1 CYTH domain-containing protein [Pseudomonadota bacterium]